MKAYQVGKEVAVTRNQFGGHAGFSTVYQWNSPKLYDLYNATEVMNWSGRDDHYRELTQLCLQKNIINVHHINSHFLTTYSDNLI